MVSHQNGSVLTVSSHIASPAQGVWTHLQPPRCFYGLLLCLQFWKLRPRTRSRNINGRLIWHKISPFGPGLCRTSDFLPTDNKNYSLSLICPPSGVPWPHRGRGERHIYWGDRGGGPGEQNCHNQCYNNKEAEEGDSWLGHMVPRVCFEFLQELAWHKLKPFHVSEEQWIWENVVWEH